MQVPLTPCDIFRLIPKSVLSRKLFLSVFVTLIKFNMVLWMGKEYPTTFKSLNAREKAHPLSGINLKSVDVNLCALSFDSICFKNFDVIKKGCLMVLSHLTHLCRPVRSTCAVRDTASLGIMGAPRVPALNPSETIVLSDNA